MVYLAIYLLIGIAVMAIATGYAYLSPRYRYQRIAYRLVHYNDKARWRVSANRAWIFCMCSVIWPLSLVAMRIVFQQDDDDDEQTVSVPDDPPRLEMLEQLDLDTAAAREIIHDPHGGAPAVPCGHLNRLWLDFCAEMQADDQLWAFRQVNTEDEPFVLAAGYCLIRKGAVAARMITHGCCNYELAEIGADYARLHAD